MNQELVKSLDRKATPSRETEYAAAAHGAVARPHPARTDVAHPRGAVRGTAKTATAWAVRAVALVILGVIVWLWLHGGGITGVHSLAALFTSVGRITGLLGAYALLIQV